MKGLECWLCKIGAKRLSGSRFMISIIEQPREIFSVTDDVSVPQLMTEIDDIVADSFEKRNLSQGADSTKCHLMEADNVAIAHSSDKVLGFSSSKNSSVPDVFYLHGVSVSGKSKSTGVGKALVDALISIHPCAMIAFTTQSPIMFGLLRGRCQEVFPNPTSHVVPTALQPIGVALSVGRNGTFNPQTFVFTRLYEFCLYNSIPRSRDVAVNKWFWESLEIRDGMTRDGFLLIGLRQGA